jgi:hypothetical protein
MLHENDTQLFESVIPSTFDFFFKKKLSINMLKKLTSIHQNYDKLLKKLIF